MNNRYLNIYNNLIKLTRSKFLYINLKENETFSDRMTFLLLHLSFFFKNFKKNHPKDELQELHDFIFKQIEISIREMGFGDVSINKNMKKYVNFFYQILSKIDKWENYNFDQKGEILSYFVNKPKNIEFYTNYFDKLITLYKNNTLNYFAKDIEEIKI